MSARPSATIIFGVDITHLEEDDISFASIDSLLKRFGDKLKIYMAGDWNDYYEDSPQKIFIGVKIDRLNSFTPHVEYNKSGFEESVAFTEDTFNGEIERFHIFDKNNDDLDDRDEYGESGNQYRQKVIDFLMTKPPLVGKVHFIFTVI